MMLPLLCSGRYNYCKSSAHGRVTNERFYPLSVTAKKDTYGSSNFLIATTAPNLHCIYETQPMSGTYTKPVADMPSLEMKVPLSIAHTYNSSPLWEHLATGHTTCIENKELKSPFYTDCKVRDHLPQEEQNKT